MLGHTPGVRWLATLLATLYEGLANAGTGMLMLGSAFGASTCNAGVTGSTPVGGSSPCSNPPAAAHPGIITQPAERSLS